MWKHFKNLKNISFRSQLLFYFLILSIFPVIVISFVLFHISKESMMELATQNMMENINKNNDLLEQRFDDFETLSLYLNVNDDLYHIFLELGPSPSDYQIITANRKIQKILTDYFVWEEYYSVHLVTSYFRFGSPGKNAYSPESFQESVLYQKAIQNSNKLTWIATYDYCDMFQIEGISPKLLEYNRLFSAVRKLNISTSEKGSIKWLPSSIENPILVISFSEDHLASLFAKNDSDAIETTLLTEDGQIVFSSMETLPEVSWLGLIPQDQSSGTLTIDLQGVETIVCYSRNPTTGWIVINSLPMNIFNKDIIKKLLLYLVFFAIFLVILSGFISFLISRKFSSRIAITLKTIEQMGAGDFSRKISYDPENEFAFFYEKINSTNRRLQKLIHENYEITLRQKESEILLLNIQLNPHFLYNTLNIINWICLDGNTALASNIIVELSRMLQYTSDNSSETSLLKDDMLWIKDYISLMSIRFENQFDVFYDIPEELYEISVPKLFLQPLIENSIIHGFQNIDCGGKIIISGKTHLDTVVFYVEDNGCGMSEEAIEDVMSGKSSSIGIQNSDKRIKLLYGDQYGIQIKSLIEMGTKIKITLPYILSTNK